MLFPKLLILLQFADLMTCLTAASFLRYKPLKVVILLFLLCIILSIWRASVVWSYYEQQELDTVVEAWTTDFVVCGQAVYHSADLGTRYFQNFKFKAK